MDPFVSLKSDALTQKISIHRSFFLLPIKSPLVKKASSLWRKKIQFRRVKAELEDCKKSDPLSSRPVNSRFYNFSCFPHCH